jgi:hypothetical protein
MRRETMQTTIERPTDLVPISEVLDAIDVHRSSYHADRVDGAGADEKIPHAHPMSDGRARKVARVLHIAANLSADYLDRLVDMADLVCEAYNSGSPDCEPERVALLARTIQGLGFDADEYFMTPSELDERPAGAA